MKRSLVLAALLLLVLLIWGGLSLRDRQWRQWLATARRDELESYVSAHPDEAAALIRLSALRRSAGETAGAEKLARRAVDIVPNEVAAWVEYSHTLTEDRDAIRALEGYLKVNPQSAPVLAELARRYLQSGDITGARSLSEEATAASPGLADAWRIRGDVMAGLRLQPEAEKSYRRALSLHEDAETRLSLARTLIPLQRYAEILSICSPILQAGQTADISQGERARALLYYAGGRLYEPLTPREIEALQVQLREADSLSQKLPAEERFLPPYFLGESFLRLNRPADAIPFLKRSASEGPMFAGSLYSLARAYRLVGDTTNAASATARHTQLSRVLGELEMFNSRLEQRPDDWDSMLKLASTLTEWGIQRMRREYMSALSNEASLWRSRNGA